MGNEITFETLFDGEDEIPVEQMPGTEGVPGEGEVTPAGVDESGEIDFGGEDAGEGGQDAIPVAETTPSNAYASIALALHKDGLLTLDEEEVKKVKDASDLATLFQKQVDTLLDDKQKRIAEALGNDVPVDKVTEFERTLSFLDGITEDSLKAETPEAEQLRGNIIFQDFINRGFSKERASKEVKKSVQAGTDVDDALEALQENKTFFQGQYEAMVNSAKAEREKAVQKEKETAASIEKMILETKEPIPGISLTDLDRKKFRDQWKSFVGKDEQGKPLTALQEYARKNPDKYQYNVNLLYYLTKGFSDFSPVVKTQVKQKTKTALEGIEKSLRTPADQVGLGGLSFGNSTEEDSRFSFRG
jgi:hypothetical protein